jgi:hypothetical protein
LPAFARHFYSQIIIFFLTGKKQKLITDARSALVILPSSVSEFVGNDDRIIIRQPASSVVCLVVCLVVSFSIPASLPFDHSVDPCITNW